MRLSRRWRRVPKLDTAGGDEARRAVRDAVRRLDDAIRRDPEVTDRARRLEQIHRENHLAPRILGAIGAHRE